MASNLTIPESDLDLPICIACGTQHDPVDRHNAPPERCRICDDPRQFVPPTGQAWTTLRSLQGSHHNEWAQDPDDERVWSFWTEPKFGIGQRSFVLRTEEGLIIWDVITLLDAATIAKIQSLGKLHAIVISHPHYYTTMSTWAATFSVPVVIGVEDREWVCRRPPPGVELDLLEGPAGTEEGRRSLGGANAEGEVVKAVKTGGHFPGSLVLHWGTRLWIADSIVTVPSAYSPRPRPPGQTTYSFMWSIPNQIPLSPDEIHMIWKAVKDLRIESTYGAFVGMDIKDPELKGRILQSMQTQVRRGGWKDAAILNEKI